ncbi:hypothetical protein BD560DRAFT_339798 [Blakeslea trispora]|nr:hypothetical protein BD560DRAFT_339798 [Blakeslea trispora]
MFKRDAVYSLAVLLRRLAYPSRLKDLSLLFGYGFSTISIIVNGMLDLLDDLFSSGIEFDEHQFRVQNLKRFNAAIIEKGSYFSDVVAFIDGTYNAICRPTENQEVCYNGHERNHCLKYQGMFYEFDTIYNVNYWLEIVEEVEICIKLAVHKSGIVTPDGITSSLAGATGKLYALYGDAAYGRHECLIKPITNRSRARRTIAAIRINQEMSRLRVAVEWEFGHTSTLFAHVHFQPKMKLMQNRVGPTYRVATLFKNIHVCINGGKSNEQIFFLCRPSYS